MDMNLGGGGHYSIYYGRAWRKTSVGMKGYVGKQGRRTSAFSRVCFPFIPLHFPLTCNALA